MGGNTRFLRCLVVTVAVAGAAALVCASPVPAPASASSDTALWVRGAARVEIPIADVLKRIPPGYALKQVDYPAGLWPWTGFDTATGAQSIAVGVPALDQAIQASQSQGRTLVIGESLGSLVVDQQLRDLTGRPDAPDPATVRFGVVAAPARPGGLLSYLPVGTYDPLTGTRVKPVPETPYDVTVLKLQYDAIASWPDRPWHLLAVLNAIAGSILYHGTDHYGNAAQDVMNGRVPPEHITATVNSLGGVTTTYTVQQNPAFLHPLEPIFPEAVAAVNKLLTPIINLGYSELTPDAGPHLAPGGQLVDKNGRAVFPLPAAQHRTPRALPSAAAVAASPPAGTRRAKAASPSDRGPVSTRVRSSR
jgi:hypothetical protein